MPRTRVPKPEETGETPREQGMVLKDNKKPTLVTETRIRDLADRIVNSGYTKWDAVQHCVDTYGVGKSQAIKYYYASLRYLTPDNPEQYREALIEKNFHVLETILKTALDTGNLKEANNAVRIMNEMLGVSGRSLNIKAEGDEKTTISISFTE